LCHVDADNFCSWTRLRHRDCPVTWSRTKIEDPPGRGQKPGGSQPPLQCVNKNLVLVEQTVLLFEVAIKCTRVEVCVVAVGAAIFMYVFKILRGDSANRSTARRS
jgi:hypothetical protein